MGYFKILTILAFLLIQSGCVPKLQQSIPNQKEKSYINVLFVYGDISRMDAISFSNESIKRLNMSFVKSGINNITFLKKGIRQISLKRRASEYNTHPEEIIRKNINSKKLYAYKKAYKADILIFIKKECFALTEGRFDLIKQNKLLSLSGSSKFTHDLKNTDVYTLKHRQKVFRGLQIVVNLDFSDDGFHTVIHEVGHLLGLSHGHEDIGMYKFSKGFAVPNKVASVMCYGGRTNSKEIPIFSGPNVFYKGIRMGNRNHDAVRTIRLIVPKIKKLSNSIY